MPNQQRWDDTMMTDTDSDTDTKMADTNTRYFFQLIDYLLYNGIRKIH